MHIIDIILLLLFVYTQYEMYVTNTYSHLCFVGSSYVFKLGKVGGLPRDLPFQVKTGKRTAYLLKSKS